MVYNNNSSNVTMTFKYKTWITAAQSLLQKNLNYWWNFLWILTTSNPFNNVAWATMSVDFTNNGSSNLQNIVNTTYTWDTSSKNITNPQLWEAYWIFINERESIYWWVNNWWNEILDVDCDDVYTILNCTLWNDSCPWECWYIAMNSNNNWVPKTILRWTNNVVILSWWTFNAKQGVITSFTIWADSVWVSKMTLIINNFEEYEWIRTEIWDNVEFRFNNVELQPNDKFYFTVDIADDYNLYWSNITFSWSNNILLEAKYSEDNIPIWNDEIVWYVSFEQIEIKPVQLSLTKKYSDLSEYNSVVKFYINNKTEKKSVLRALYTTDENFNGNWSKTHIDSIYIWWTDFQWNNLKFIIEACINNFRENCHEVGQITQLWEQWRINIEPLYTHKNIWINDLWIVIYAEINAVQSHIYDDYYVVVSWKDNFGNKIWPAQENLKTFEVEEWAYIVVIKNYEPEPRQSWKNQLLASFKVSSSNTQDEIYFNEFILSWNINWSKIESNNITLSEWYFVDESEDWLIYKTSNNLSDGSVTVDITSEEAIFWNADIELVSVNWIAQWILFNNTFIE